MEHFEKTTAFPWSREGGEKRERERERERGKKTKEKPPGVGGEVRGGLERRQESAEGAGAVEARLAAAGVGGHAGHGVVAEGIAGVFGPVVAVQADHAVQLARAELGAGHAQRARLADRLHHQRTETAQTGADGADRRPARRQRRLGRLEALQSAVRRLDRHAAAH